MLMALKLKLQLPRNAQTICTEEQASSNHKVLQLSGKNFLFKAMTWKNSDSHQALTIITNCSKLQTETLSSSRAMNSLYGFHILTYQGGEKSHAGEKQCEANSNCHHRSADMRVHRRLREVNGK